MHSIRPQAARGSLSIEEFDKAETAIVCFCQKKRFPDEMTSLQKGGTVKRNSHLYRLDPILEEGVLRVRGRLKRAAMPDEARHPVILAMDVHITDSSFSRRRCENSNLKSQQSGRLYICEMDILPLFSSEVQSMQNRRNSLHREIAPL